MSTTPLDIDYLHDIRRWYADEIRYASGVNNETLLAAFARVPREKFLGPGPWQIRSFRGYVTTPDDDPAHVYHNALVAIDASRGLNNGHPSSWAYWLSQIEPRAGDQIMHVGCGTGYYTAIMAELSGANGSVLAFEIDAELAQRAQASLQDRPEVHVTAADCIGFTPGPLDLIVVSAGVVVIPTSWLQCLTPGGRMLLPLTVPVTVDANHSTGRMLTIEKRANGLAARFIGYASFFPCSGTTDLQVGAALGKALKRRDEASVQSVRLDAHTADSSCWLHTEHYCLSRQPVGGSPVA